MIPRHPTAGTALERARQIAPRPGLAALVLFGSRATGATHGASDWDFGVLRAAGSDGAGLDLEALRADLTRAVGSDAVDLVDLGRASALLRYRVARDGRAIHEAARGAFLRFQIDATSFWCDVEPVLRRAHRSVLNALGAG